MAEHRHKILMDLVFYYGRALSDCTSNCIVTSSYGTTLKYDDSPSFCALWKCENVLLIGFTCEDAQN
jgi:hypothetical protein